MKLSSYINSILELEQSTILSEDESFAINGFDRAILILDDIEDQSQIRDGEPCLYITQGIPKAKKEAEKLHKEAFTALSNLCKQRKLSFIKSFYVKYLLHKLHRKIKIGQKIDKQLQSTTADSSLLSKYDQMISLFTGGHIRHAFLIGFTLSGKNPSYKSKVISIGEYIGILRQLDDDIKDYYGEHHEPLGDLLQHKNRLPELLFHIYATPDEEEKLKSLLLDPLNNQKEIQDLILNKKVQKNISEKIADIKTKIELNMDVLPKNYKSYLCQLMLRFLK